MARAMWSGTISFGLLNVPVKLYSAVARRNIALREIRDSDSARIKHRRVAEGTDEEVPYENIVKAYELTPGQYVPLSKDEMAALAPEKTRAIDVLDFVDIEEIDPMYFDSPYYLGPAEGAEKAYSLLGAAMEASRQGGDHPLRLPQQGAPGGAPRRRRRPDPDHDALRRRGRAAFRSRRRDPGQETEGREEGAGDGRTADRLALDRIRPERLPRRVPRAAAGADRTEGRRQGDRRAGGRGAEGDQSPRPDGGAGGEHRRGQGQGRQREGERNRRRKPKKPPRRAKRKQKALPAPKPKPRNRPWARLARSRSTARSCG